MRHKREVCREQAAAVTGEAGVIMHNLLYSAVYSLATKKHAESPVGR